MANRITDSHCWWASLTIVQIIAINNDWLSLVEFDYNFRTFDCGTWSSSGRATRRVSETEQRYAKWTSSAPAHQPPTTTMARMAAEKTSSNKHHSKYDGGAGGGGGGGNKHHHHSSRETNHNTNYSSPHPTSTHIDLRGYSQGYKGGRDRWDPKVSQKIGQRDRDWFAS